MCATEGNQTNTRNLFLSKMRNEGGKAAADARGAGATHGRPIGGTQHATRLAPDVTAGGTTVEGPTLGICNYVELIDTIFTDVEGVD